MKNIGHLMKQAQKMQEDMTKAQEKIALMECVGVSGAGLVKVTISGKGEMKSVFIDKSLITEDIEIMQDLIVAAFNDAKNKMDQTTSEEMKKVTGGLPDGFKLPF